MSVSDHSRSGPCPAPAGRDRGIAGRLLITGAALAFLAALLLWWRFGPSVFVDALGAVWTCL